MPYQGERAYPYGYGDLLSSDFVKERLGSFLPRGGEEEASEEVTLPILSLEELPEQLTYDLTSVVALDGSLQVVEVTHPSLEVGFLKVGVVVERLQALRELEGQAGPVATGALAKAYRTYSISTVLPGRGIEDEDEALSGRRKFAKELYANVKAMKATLSQEGEGDTLLTTLSSLFPQGFPVYCEACEDWQKFTSTVAVNCPSCGGLLLYPSDCLKLHSLYNASGTNSKLYSETMSTLERLLMAGLLRRAASASGGRPLLSTAFITDGSLALFQAGALVVPLLTQVQTLPHFPLLMGIEKTGAAVELMKRQSLREALGPGQVLMFTPAVLEQLKGGYSEGFRNEPFYGRRFAYRTRRGDKTFVISLPPRRGVPSTHSDDVWEDWEAYPTVRAACELLELTSTDLYGPATAAVTSVAKANDTASIPLGLGALLLQEYVRETFGGNASS